MFALILFDFRMLHRVSKFIPNEKLESYLKTFDDIHYEIYSKTATPKNWVKWCLERFDCNSTNPTNNMTTMTDTKLH